MRPIGDARHSALGTRHSPLRLAILGVGWAGTRQVEAIRELGRKVTVACLVDSDAGFLREKSAELGVARTYTEIGAALADPEVDAVSICLPHDLHEAAALAAAGAGKHILCEKPIAPTVEAATRMLDAAAGNGVKLYVAENVTYLPIAGFLRRVVQTGEFIGELTFATVTAGFRAPQFGYAGRRAWLTEPERGGTGTWMLHGVHTVAQLRHVFGEVATIYMREHRASSFARPAIEGTMSGLLTLESGVNVALTQSCETAIPADLGGYALHGDRGSLHAGRDGCTVYPHEGPPLRLGYPAAALSDYAQEIDAFADYVVDGVEGPTTGRGERRSLAVVQAGYESARTGRAITLRERFGPL